MFIQVIIPCAGEGSRFKEAGFTKPKPFIDVFGRPMIKRVIENIVPKGRPYILTVLARPETADQISRMLRPQDRVIVVDKLTEGAACTLLLAKPFITQEPILIANCDQIVDVMIDDFLSKARKTAGLIMCFKSRAKKWSYAKTYYNRVIRVAEKQPISTKATVGIYYYQNGREFLEAAERMIERNDRTNGEFYIAPIYNELMDKNIRTFMIRNDQFHGLGVPKDYYAYLQSNPFRS